MEKIRFITTFDAIGRLIITMQKLPEDKRVLLYNNIVVFVAEYRDTTGDMKKPIAVINENLERLLYSCRCLAGLEDSSYPDVFYTTWAIMAIYIIRSNTFK